MSTIAPANEAAGEEFGALWREAIARHQTNQEERVSMDQPVITMVDPRTVTIPPRLRPEDPAHTAAFRPSIARDGVREPIEVREVDGKPELISGLHRLRGALLEELPLIPAIFRVANDDKAKLLEIEENLIRHDLNALDRAVFMAEWKAVYDRMYPLAGKRGRKLGQVGPILLISAET